MENDPSDFDCLIDIALRGNVLRFSAHDYHSVQFVVYLANSLRALVVPVMTLNRHGRCLVSDVGNEIQSSAMVTGVMCHFRAATL
jgi:hypothetical protein